MLSVSRLAYGLGNSVWSGAWSWVDLQSLRRRKCRCVHSPQQTLQFPVAPTRLRRSSDHDSGYTGRLSDGRVLRSRHRPASSSKPILPLLLTPPMPLHLLLVLRFAVAASVHVDSVATHVEDRANRCVVVTSPALLLVRFHTETVHDAFVERGWGFRSRNQRRRHSRREGVARSCEPGPVYCSVLTAARVERVF